MFLLSRLWDYLNMREEETLETLPQVTEVRENWDSDHSSEQERVWLNYEPNTEDLEFL